MSTQATIQTATDPAVACTAGLGSHPEDFCKVCGGENPVWFVNSKLWNKFHGPYSILCPRCFMLIAKQQGYDRVWEITPEGGYEPNDQAHT
jgi:hypothetical protein